MAEPKLMTVRHEIYDPQIEDYVKAELPTETVKKYRRLVGNGPASIVASYTGLGMRPRSEGGSFDANGRVLRIGAMADRATEYFLVDRGGTFDTMFVPASGKDDLLGAPHRPVCNVKGTFKVIRGSVSGGTYSVGFELMKRIDGTYTIS